MADRHWRWEYRVMLWFSPPSSVALSEHFKALQDWLDGIGADGWELVAVKENGYIFKRAKLT